MKRKLPKGERDLPILKKEKKFLTPRDVAKSKGMNKKKLFKKIRKQLDNEELLKKRVIKRYRQGRLYDLQSTRWTLTPEEQIRHIKKEDRIGKTLIRMEKGLLEEIFDILEERLNAD